MNADRIQESKGRRTPGPRSVVVRLVVTSIIAMIVGAAPLGVAQVSAVGGTGLGHLDGVSVTRNAITVTGWAISTDAPSTAYNNVRLTIDLKPLGSAGGTLLRPDLAAQYSQYGLNHGFVKSFSPTLIPGPHVICGFVAHDWQPWGGYFTSETFIGCVSYVEPAVAWSKVPAVAYEVAAASPHSGGAGELFHVGREQAVYRQAQSAGITAWQVVPGVSATKIAAASTSDDRVVLAVVTPSTQQLSYSIEVTRGGVFGPSTALPLRRLPSGAVDVPSDIAVAVLNEADVVVLYTSAIDNGIYMMWPAKASNVWVSLPGQTARRLSVTVSQSSYSVLTVAYVGMDRNIYINDQIKGGPIGAVPPALPAGTPGGWAQLGSVAFDVDLVREGVGYRVTHVGTSGGMYTTHLAVAANGRLSNPSPSWLQLPGVASSVAVIAADGDSTYQFTQVAHVGADANIYVS